MLSPVDLWKQICAEAEAEAEASAPLTKEELQQLLEKGVAILTQRQGARAMSDGGVFRWLGIGSHSEHDLKSFKHAIGQRLADGEDKEFNKSVRKFLNGP